MRRHSKALALVCVFGLFPGSTLAAQEQPVATDKSATLKRSFLHAPP